MKLRQNKHYKAIVLLCFILVSPVLFAQQSTASEKTIKPDSLRAPIDSDPLLEINSVFERFELTRQLNMPEMSKLLKKDSGDAWLMMRVMINSGYFSSNGETNAGADLLKPLYNNYMDSQKFSTLNYILGMAQVSAVGYMAYQHIKKYGFLKRK